MARKLNARKQRKRASKPRGSTNPQPPTRPARKSKKPRTLTDEEEQRALSMAYALFFVLTEYFAPSVRSFLVKHKLLTPPLDKNYDCAVLLRMIISEIESGRPQVFPGTTLSVAVLRCAIKGRNGICHLNVSKIMETWEETFNCWIALCKDMHDEDTATNIQVVYNVKMKENYGTLGFRTIQLPLKSFDQGDAFILNQILFGCILRYVAPAIRNFLRLRNPNKKSISLDLYINLKEIIGMQRQQPDYLASGGVLRNDQNTLDVSMTARNHACHGYFTEIFTDWDSYMKSWIKLLDVLGESEAMASLQSIYNTLVTAKRTRRVIQLAELFEFGPGLAT